MQLKHPPRPRSRTEIKAWNRRKIIDAAVYVINTHGITGTTVARVIELAEVSMGLVNLHFGNKEKLLEAVLTDLAESYDEQWQEALKNAPDDTRAKIRSLVQADISPAVLNPETLGVWYAFRAQIRINSSLTPLFGNRDRNLSAQYASLFKQLNRETGCQHCPETVTRGLIAMLEGVWADFFLYPGEFNRQKALAMLSLYLESVYPVSFDLE